MVKTKKRNIIICIIATFFSIIMLVIGFVVPKLSGIEIEIESNEREATVVEVLRKDKDYLIVIEEYSCGLFVDSEAIINKEALLFLNKGDKIFFKLVKLEENILENSQIDQVFVVTLRTEKQEIITLQSYAQIEEQDIKNVKITSIIVAIIFGGISIFNFVMILKKKKQTKT